MIKRYTGLILIFTVLLVIPLQSYAATPKETVETGVNNLLETLGSKDFKAKSKEKQVAELGKQIEKVFDFTELSKRTLGRDW